MKHLAAAAGSVAARFRMKRPDTWWKRQRAARESYVAKPLPMLETWFGQARLAPPPIWTKPEK
jgi:hypothetical protein